MSSWVVSGDEISALNSPFVRGRSPFPIADLPNFWDGWGDAHQRYLKLIRMVEDKLSQKVAERIRIAVKLLVKFAESLFNVRRDRKNMTPP